MFGTLFKSKLTQYKEKFEAIREPYFWAFDSVWNQAIDTAIANNNADWLEELYDTLTDAIENTPQEFPMWFIIHVPREIEDAFAKKTKQADHKVLHWSLAEMTSDDQEKVVKALIKFWWQKAPNDVPMDACEWAMDKPSVQREVVPHGAIADTYQMPKVEPIFDPSSFNILLGENTAKKPLHWTPSQETNGFIMVIGASGSGKTESLKAIATEVHNYGIPALIIDFHGDITLDVAKNISLSHAPSCQYGINPLELDSLHPDTGGVFPQVQKLIESITAFNSAIGHKQKLNIEKYICAAYEAKGISDNDINSWQLAPPTFADVIHLMEADSENKDVSSALAVVRSVFKHPVFSKPLRLDIEALLTNSHRINLKPLDGADFVQFIVVDTLLRKVGCALSSKGHIPVKCSDRERYRLGVFMDEAHRFVGKSSNRKGIIDIYALEYRKFGLLMGLGSQNLDHFSPDTISQVATKIQLKLQSAESARFPANEFGLSVDAITNGLRGKGHGYVKRGSAAPVEFQFTPIHKR